MGWTLFIKLAGEFFSRWLEKFNLRKQGAQEQRLVNEKKTNEQLGKVLDARNRSDADRVRDEDYRD